MTLATLRRRLSEEGGFTLALVAGVLVFAALLGAAAYGAARGEIGQSGETRDAKQAYAAAEAGINWYMARLTADNEYWAKCTSVPAVATGIPAPVNAEWNGTMPDTRTRWRTLTGSTAKYAIELLPRPGASGCSSTTMIDATGALRIRSTGVYNGKYRSIVARLTRVRFLDFLYFTKYETTDPLAYPSSQIASANTYCADRYRTARANSTFSCKEIQFASFDAVRGPLHSNDSLLICGASTFGRAGKEDSVETSASAPGFSRPGGSGCSTAPNFQTGFKTGANPLEMPETNDLLASSAGLTLNGTNRIVLKSNGTMDVTRVQTGVTTNYAVPANGLVYVDTDTTIGGCSRTVPPLDVEYGGTNTASIEPNGCANAYVSGSYNRSVTIASAKDVIVNANLTMAAGADVLAGLIANNFVRVYHPVTTHSTTNGACDGDNITATSGDVRAPYGPAMTNVRIDAAILSLQHSFTVDSYDCGAALSNLTVSGAIAQKYRGAVGTSGGTGYAKDYNYDDRLKYRNPPLFLDPLNAAWKVLRTNEQVPARAPR
jgi:hypothetical protein